LKLASFKLFRTITYVSDLVEITTNIKISIVEKAKPRVIALKSPLEHQRIGGKPTITTGMGFGLPHKLLNAFRREK
jgi:hypothetical protein